MHYPRTFLLLGCFLAAAFGNADAWTAEPDPKGIEFFEKFVRPVFVQHCYECHSEKKTNGGLRLDSRAGWSIGGDSGPALVPGKPDESLLVQAIRYGGDYEMPPKGKLPTEVIKNIERWVSIGAPDPRSGVATAKPTTTVDVEAGRKHWSYRPIELPATPHVQDTKWPYGAIDCLVLAKLEAHGLRPSADSERIVFIRRLHFDLLGLAPSTDEIDQFIKDRSPDAYEKLVDRLLASPRFGERWGRHWLDVARYAESLTLRGFVFKEAWRYRDYVIEAFNEDRPFDTFIREQIAGDLFPAKSPADRQRLLTATTYLTLGNTNLEEQDKKLLEMDFIDEQLDVITKGILAQTVTCARCHDHKFDPIPQRDYYALAAIFENTKALEHANVSKWVEAPLPAEPDQDELIRRHDEIVVTLQKKLQAAKTALKRASSSKIDVGTPALVLAPSQLPGVVVDDQQAKRVGDWKESQFSKRYIGAGYLHDMDQGKGQKTLTFVPELPQDGKYEVRFAYSFGASRSAAVNLTVFSADGEKTVTVDETDPPPIDGRFVSLGQFRFEKAGQSFVIVHNEGTRGHVTADAVQFLPSHMAADVTARSGTSDSGQKVGQATQLTSMEKEVKRLEAEMKKLAAKAPYRPMAMTIVENPKISEGRINIRGVVHNLGDPVPRGFLQVCSTGTPVTMPSDESGRVELAEWLTNPNNPLTARVMVNRIWRALFGSGIVRTVDNFGTTGETPSHPELLDHLANRFVESCWSVKQIVRAIVLSRTYRQASLAQTSDPRAAIDPENRLFWRMNRRRLEAECLRDAMLQTSGQLRLEMGGPQFDPELAADYGFQHVGTRRSVYEPVFRNALPEIFEAFDFADPSLVTGRRSTSTVAPQALFLMNHPFVLQQSRVAAQDLLDENALSEVERIERIFWKSLGRPPTTRESDAAISFLTQAGLSGDAESKLQAWSQLCQSLFGSIDFRYIE